MPATYRSRAYDYISYKDQIGTIRNTIMHYIWANIKQKSAGVHFAAKICGERPSGHIQNLLIKGVWNIYL